MRAAVPNAGGNNHHSFETLQKVIVAWLSGRDDIFKIILQAKNIMEDR